GTKKFVVVMADIKAIVFQSTRASDVRARFDLPNFFPFSQRDHVKQRIATAEYSFAISDSGSAVDVIASFKSPIRFASGGIKAIEFVIITADQNPGSFAVR